MAKPDNPQKWNLQQIMKVLRQNEKFLFAYTTCVDTNNKGYETCGSSCQTYFFGKRLRHSIVFL